MTLGDHDEKVPGIDSRELEKSFQEFLKRVEETKSALIRQEAEREKIKEKDAREGESR